jgi:hypothetical protein
MSFKVKDLAMNVGGLNADDTSTCTTLTRTTSGDCLGSLFFRDGASSGNRNLSLLKAQLRQAVART